MNLIMYSIMKKIGKKLEELMDVMSIGDCSWMEIGMGVLIVVEMSALIYLAALLS